MPLFEVIPIDKAAVAAVVAERWGLILDQVLKESQNHTFAAHAADDAAAKYAVRVTPDPSGKEEARVADELTYTRAVGAALPPGSVCMPVPPTRPATTAAAAAAAASTGASTATATSTAVEYYVRAGPLLICVFPWATGAPVDFAAYTWMTDEGIVTAWGAWLARLHAASRAFAASQPAVARRIRQWYALHGGLMEGVVSAAVCDEDAAVAAAAAAAGYTDVLPAAASASASASGSDADGDGAVPSPCGYGILHGDCNVSNFYLVGSPPSVELCVFDFDQVQCGWWEADLAQALLSAYMLCEGGSLPARAPVPAAQPARMTEWMVSGYERVAGPGAVCRPRLARMVALRKLFYRRFCSRALAEEAAGIAPVPDAMRWFLQYCMAWIESPLNGAEAVPLPPEGKPEEQ